MKPFPYDEFKPVFKEELKALFARFIERNRDKKPYAFVLAAGLCTVGNEAGKLSDVEFYALWAGGNTVADFDAKGECSAAELMSNLKTLIARREKEGIAFEEQSEKLRREIFKSDEDPIAMEYYYFPEEWSDSAFTNKVLPKSNAIIGNYVLENQEDFTDEEDEFTEAFEQLETEFLNFLIACLKELRAGKFFESVYPERIFVNFEVREHYSAEEEVRLFEALNSKEEAALYARLLYGC